MPIRWLGHKVSPHVFNFIWNTCYFIWNHLTNEMILTTLPLHRRSGWWVGGGGASTHLVFTGTLYLFVHISYENTHQHFAFFTFILFHMKYTLSISYEICTHLAGLCIRWVKPFYFSEHFIWNFILISSCLISIYLFELTQQYFVSGWRCVDVLVVLCRKAFAVCSGGDSRLFLGHDNSLVFSSVVFVWFLCLFEVDWHQF